MGGRHKLEVTSVSIIIFNVTYRTIEKLLGVKRSLALAVGSIQSITDCRNPRNAEAYYFRQKPFLHTISPAYKLDN